MASQRITHFSRDGLTFPVVDEGPLDGDPIVLLHGWPQDGQSWDRVTPLLNERGYRTIVPTLRGAVASAAPRSRWAYRKREIRKDIVTLIDEIGRPVHLVGHDWGAAVAWSLACAEPDRLLSLTAVSVPHVGAFVRALPVSRQFLSSWYMGAFQFPFAPELVLGSVPRMTGFLVKAGQEPELARRDAQRMQNRAIMRGGLNLYRSIIGDFGETRGHTTVPVLQVWGDDDVAVTKRAIDGAHRYADGHYELAVFSGAGHWVPESRPQELATAIADHIARFDSQDAP